MKCPYCGEENTKVIDSRPADDNSSIRRRRQCEKCGKRFTTYEKLETMPLMVIKKDETREPYDRAKIENGVVQSCHKRPVSTQQIDAVIDSIENQMIVSAFCPFCRDCRCSQQPFSESKWRFASHGFRSSSAHQKSFRRCYLAA